MRAIPSLPLSFFPRARHGRPPLSTPHTPPTMKPSTLTVAQLKEELKQRGLGVDGLKAALVERLEAALAAEAPKAAEAARSATPPPPLFLPPRTRSRGASRRYLARAAAAKSEFWNWLCITELKKRKERRGFPGWCWSEERRLYFQRRKRERDVSLRFAARAGTLLLWLQFWSMRAKALRAMRLGLLVFLAAGPASGAATSPDDASSPATTTPTSPASAAPPSCTFELPPWSCAVLITGSAPISFEVRSTLVSSSEKPCTRESIE